ncbi:hypothetical protein ACS0TY_019337 [Phlomoides rotata]
MRLYCFDRTFFHSSHSLNPIQIPAPMETHLWYIKPSKVKSESLLKQYLGILSPCERENVLRMQGEELRKGALLARTLVRTTIARYQTNSQIDPRSLKFQKNTHGKHELKFNSSLLFRSACILPNKYFHSNIELLACSLEAYVKALGKGFSGAPFNTFTIRFKEDTRTKASDIFVDSFDDVRSWQFSLLELANSHYVAICTKNHAASEGERNIPRKLRVWRTIPLLEDECVSRTDAIKTICDF